MTANVARQGASPATNKALLAVPEGLNRRCDLPPEAYWMPDRVNAPFARRPGYSTAGASISLGVNQFRVEKYGTGEIYQFDISISPEPKGAAVYKKVWNSTVVKNKLSQYKGFWLYDNRKLAWSKNNIQKLECQVDLAAEQGRPSRDSDRFTFTIKQTGKIHMNALQAYLTGQMSWDTSVLECINFLDHALRQQPSETMKLIKRTLFNEYSETRRLNSYSEAIKGIYSAIRLSESIQRGGTGLAVNVDVANQTFWVGQKFEQLARNYLSCVDRKWDNLNYETMRRALMPVKVNSRDGPPTWGMSEAFKALRRLQNIRFTVKHRGDSHGTQEYKVKRIMFDPKYGEEGANAKAVKFDKKMPDGTTKTYSVFEYFLEQHKARIQHWYFPLIETGRNECFPMEYCEVVRFNPYPFKLDPAQTSEMIKFAVQRPQQRMAEVAKMVRNLNWAGDRYLDHFGIKINPSMPKIEGRLLPNPVVQFGNKSTDPKTTGRWDLRGARFTIPNRKPLTSWAFVSVDGCVDRQTLDTFSKKFSNVYKSHGGKIERNPLILGYRGMPHDQMVVDAYNTCGNQNKQTPQIIFFVLRDKSAWVYDRLKRNAECRLAAVTQMVQAAHVAKAAPQYLSNVCMKVNAKLGGQTSGISHRGPVKSFFDKPTMVIGVDVSHGHAGNGPLPVSVAAMCVSMDKEAAIYDARVQTNGWAVEILQPVNMHSMLGPLIKKWRAKHNVAPKQVFYMRDGVSEGQFAHVMQFEYQEMRKVFEETTGVVPKITVIIATKRHHIRFFAMEQRFGDKNQNCLPGTLVDREVTHPFHYDFYLCSHSAIQGTARPVHYNVIHDECQLDPGELQRILYHQCYQYCRSTTPISLHPAVYYAHLAGARARHHENMATDVQMTSDTKYQVLTRPGLMAKRDGSTTATTHTDTQPAQLLAPGSHGGRKDAIEAFVNTMWWV